MFLEAALDLTQFGFKVFPLLPGEKIPAVPKSDGGRGCLDATDDEYIIEAWARRFPKANIGIACGLPSGIIVIDLDPRNGSDASLRKLAERKQTFPPTVTVRTANGGVHLYYALEPSLKNSKSVLAPGIDVKTSGGYVVAPPSELHGGKPYSWINSPLGDRFPRLPQWAAHALKPKPVAQASYDRKDAPKDIAPLANFVSRIGEGSRNKSLYWAACRAAESGLLTQQARAALIEAAKAAGLPDTEVIKTIESARKRAILS
jgi:hypothetical protein